jgi:hypothetical protein
LNFKLGLSLAKMEDDLNKNENGRPSQFLFEKIEDVKKMEDDLNKMNGRQTQNKFKEWKTT